MTGRDGRRLVRRADPAARRRGLLLLVAITGIGALLIAGQSLYREPLAAWIVADPALTRARGRLLILATGAFLVVPLGVFAIYLWRLGSRTIAHREFPPPEEPMLRDTEIVTGEAAIAHGRGLRALAILFAIAMVGLTVALWRIASLLTR